MKACLVFHGSKIRTHIRLSLQSHPIVTVGNPVSVALLSPQSPPDVVHLLRCPNALNSLPLGSSFSWHHLMNLCVNSSRDGKCLSWDLPPDSQNGLASCLSSWGVPQKSSQTPTSRLRASCLLSLPVVNGVTPACQTGWSHTPTKMESAHVAHKGAKHQKYVVTPWAPDNVSAMMTNPSHTNR